MKKFNLFTININETVEDAEWAGMYVYLTTPTNFVFASFDDAFEKAHEMVLQKIKEIDADGTKYAVDLESTIVFNENSVIMHYPWSEGECIEYAICELKWCD